MNVCPMCQTELPAMARFCHHCGYQYKLPFEGLQQPETPTSSEASAAETARPFQEPAAPVGGSFASFAQMLNADEPATSASRENVSKEASQSTPGERPEENGQVIRPFSPLLKLPGKDNASNAGRGLLARAARRASRPLLWVSRAIEDEITRQEPAIRLDAAGKARPAQKPVPTIDELDTNQMPAIGEQEKRSAIADQATRREVAITPQTPRPEPVALPPLSASASQPPNALPKAAQQEAAPNLPPALPKATPAKPRVARKRHTGRWISAALLLVLIGGGVAIYLFSPFGLRGQPNATTNQPPGNNGQKPTLKLQGAQANVARGQTLHVQGVSFEPNAQVSFFLDSTTPITNAGGVPLTVQSSPQGSFNAAIFIIPTWALGNHQIQAHGPQTERAASLTISVGPAVSTGLQSGLKLSPSQLSFHVNAGQKGQVSQSVTLTNTGTTTLIWSVTVTANQSQSWLEVNLPGGNLAAGGKTQLTVTVLPTGLPKSATPYSGQIIISLSETEQLTLPVELNVQ